MSHRLCDIVLKSIFVTILDIMTYCISFLSYLQYCINDQHCILWLHTTLVRQRVKDNHKEEVKPTAKTTIFLPFRRITSYSLKSERNCLTITRGFSEERLKIATKIVHM